MIKKNKYELFFNLYDTIMLSLVKKNITGTIGTKNIMSQIPIKKLACGYALPVFGFGTWQMGGRQQRDPCNDDQADVTAIQNAIDRGVTHIDTAAWYAQGHTEKIVGQAIKDFDRAALLITTKVAPMDLHYHAVIQSAEASLRRLATDYIDSYVIHNPNPYIPIQETMRAMDFLVDKNRVRYIGVSNFDRRQLKQAQACTCNKIVCNHLHYNLKHRGPLSNGTIQYCQDHDVMVVAWRPVQKGLFSKEKFAILQKLGAKYQKTGNQIAINWLACQKNVVTLSKTRHKGHLEENIAAVGWKMEQKDIKLLMEHFPQVVDTVENETLTRLIEPE